MGPLLKKWLLSKIQKELSEAEETYNKFKSDFWMCQLDNDISLSIQKVKVKELEDLIEEVENETDYLSELSRIAEEDCGYKKEQTEFDVVLTVFNCNKLTILRAIKDITMLSYNDAKIMANNLPSKILLGVTKETAIETANYLKSIGAIVKVI